ncbi:MAG TPA: glycosyltransferase family 39 protein [Bacteroidia bacterium]|nr:glycosyltransferase family 39 protein [Bacteroidia bacterium]
MRTTSFSKSKLVLLIIFAFLISCFFINGENRRDQIISDVVSYYGYLPAFFIYHDATLSFINKDREAYKDKYWPETTEDGRFVLKTTMGLSILYMPFFWLAHAYAKISSYAADGFSRPYHSALVLSCFFYVMVGLWYLRKLLLRYFSDTITALTLLCVYFGTNLVWYTTREAAMSHAFLFSIICVYLYFTVKWHEHPDWKNTIRVGFLIGLAILIRPTMLLLTLPFILYNVLSWKTLLEKFSFFWKERFLIILLCICVFLCIVPQMIYWHSATGHWVYYSYTAERFFFNDPHILDGLFSYRKGWLLYTPVMTVAVLGIFLFRPVTRAFNLGILATLCICVYVFFSWWSWWYGGSFGQRPMVDLYGMLALPFAAFLDWIKNRRILKWISVPVFLALISLNLFQHWQFSKGLIGMDGMTKKLYFMGFFMTETRGEWWANMERPDYDRARAGLPYNLPPTQPGRAYFYLQDFELEPLAIDGITTAIKKDGNYSFALSPAVPFSYPYVFGLEDLNSKWADSIFVNADIYCEEEISREDLFVVFSTQNDTGVTQYFSKDVAEDKNIPVNNWNKVYMSARYFYRPNTETGRIYFWNKGKKKIYVDNIHIEFKRIVQEEEKK